MSSQPSHPFVIKDLRRGDIPRVVSLLASLKEFFPEDAIAMVEFSLREHEAIVGTLDDEIVSFLAYAFRDKNTAEILWMGVKEEYHGLGLGTMMLENLEQILERKGIKQIVTSTLSYTVGYKPFDKVRAFFYHRGFKALGIQANYYQEGADRLVLIKQIGS
jgi:ribosomal protein S18 acetylase RimI-like enzyme